MRPRCLLPLALLLLALPALPARPAAADLGPNDFVPPVRNDQLCQLGTGAPIPRGPHVTHVMTGDVRLIRMERNDQGFRRSGEKGFYRVPGVQGILRHDTLGRLLQKRAGTARPSPHEVWITAASTALWWDVVTVRNLCARAGIYRVGVRVRHEQTGQVMGFPLFLPASTRSGGTASTGVAARLPVEVDPAPLDDERTSDPRLLFQAATKARELFGKPVVAQVRMVNHTPLQYALSVLDMLHRAGCVGVLVKSVNHLAAVEAPAATRIRITRRRGRDVVVAEPPGDDKPQPIIPPVAMRQAPWPLDGANRPGAFHLELLDLPGPGEKELQRHADPDRVLPNHLAAGEVPHEMQLLVTGWLQGFQRELSQDLSRALQKPITLDRPIVTRKRTPPENRLALVTAPLRTLAGARTLVLRTMSFRVMLVRQGQPVGLLDTTLLVGDGQVRLYSAAVSRDPLPRLGALPPEPADPFAAGVPGAVRVWMEAVLLAARKSGDVPALASLAHITNAIPPQERTNLEIAESQRQRDLQGAVQLVRRATFDRIMLAPSGATALAIGPRGALGRLELFLEAEKKELRISELSGTRFR